MMICVDSSIETNNIGEEAEMAEEKREFRSPESYEAEAHTRNWVQQFLEGFSFSQIRDERFPVGKGESQLIDALAPSGKPIRIRVRTCWHWGENRPPRARKFSAAQITARVKGDWIETLDNIAYRLSESGITHLLLVQADDVAIQLGALIPVTQLRPIWAKQRDVSKQVIAAGKMGRIKKNHAENGDSPTLWLMDERAPGGKEVAEVLWNWKGVTRLERGTGNFEEIDDTYADLPALDSEVYGTNGADRKFVTRSEVKRDSRVRRKVIERAVNGCERPSCDNRRVFKGFLDVHHILGVEKSDREWTCVALCPNCHREAHYGPDCDAINSELLDYAAQFVAPGKRAL
jgi:5-methylcytosine-specific restriction protein A